MSSKAKSSDSNNRIVPRFDPGSVDLFRNLPALNETSDRSLQVLVFALLEILSLQFTDNDPIKSRRLFRLQIQFLEISKMIPPGMTLTAQTIGKSAFFQNYVRKLRESFQTALSVVQNPPSHASDTTTLHTLLDNECKQVVLSNHPIPNLSIDIPQPNLQLKIPLPLNFNGRIMTHDFDNIVLYRYVHDFDELGKLGKGAFGSVFCAKNRLDNCKYAIKKITFNDNTDRTRRQAKQALREVRVLASLNHANIVQYHCAWLELVPVPHRTHRTSSSSFTSSLEPAKVKNTPQAATPMDSLDKMIQFKENSAPMSDSYPIIEENQSPQKSSTNSTSPDDDDDASEISGLEFDGKDSNREQYHSDGTDMRSASRSKIAFHQSKSCHTSGSDEKVSNRELMPLNISNGDFHSVPRPRHVSARIVLFIQMQLCNTTLHDWLRYRDQLLLKDFDQNRSKVNRTLNELAQQQCWQIFRQLLIAVEYLHSQSFVHRDIKPRNIFLAFDPKDETAIQVKLGDFGLATLLDSQISAESHPQWKIEESSGVGTALYAPPEQLNSSHCTVSERSDSYSLGIVLFELFSIFFTESERIRSLSDLRAMRKVETSFAEKYPLEAILIEELIQSEPMQRPTVASVLTTYAKEIQQRMKKPSFNSKQRIIEQLQEALRDKDRRIQQLESALERKVS